METRKYGADEAIEVGDVLDVGFAGFGTAIVQSVTDTWITVARPMASVIPITGSVTVQVETWTASPESVRDNYRVLVRGVSGTKDQRLLGPN